MKIQLSDAWLQCTCDLQTLAVFWIISIYTGHSASIAGIVKDLWNMKSILVTNLFWVITWSPSVGKWKVPFCFTIKSYTLLYHQPYTQVENQQSLVDLCIKLENKKYYHINCGVIQGFLALRKAVTTHCLLERLLLLVRTK